jgi:plasmid stabilization system protein ParE
MPNGQWGGLRTVVESEAAAAAIDAGCKTYPRLDEAWEALKWLLARSAATIGRPPRSGDPRLRLYVQSGDRIANVPSIWIVYILHEEEVEIVALRVEPLPDKEPEE